MDLYDRCITRGLPHVIFPTIYNNTSQIVQGPGYVAIRYEMIHDARVIPLDGRPQLSSTIRQYFGDSRGHWEGDTLVVEVTNFPTNIVNYRGADGALHVTERFRRVDATTVHYEVTVSDPATFSQPWTAALSLKNVRSAGRVRVRVPRRQLRDEEHPQRRARRREIAGSDPFTGFHM